MTAPALARRLGLLDATLLGVGSMLGAGVFVAFAPAAAAAGGLLLVGLAVAAVVALCNALASAQLAAQYPTSGGTYVYGRERLGAWPGFLAGWCFVIGKTASVAAMAATVAAYAVPAPLARPTAALVVLALAAINAAGVTRTAAVTRVIVVVVIAVLAVVIGVGLSAPAAPAQPSPPAAPLGVLRSAGLLFFAFAGYARIATMGEEVREPGRTIPRAIAAALAVVLAIYALVALAALHALGPSALAGATAPLVDVVAAGDASSIAPAVRLGGALAALGALLALLAGIGRTVLAMGRTGDLPRWLAAVHPRFGTPHRAEAAVGVVAAVLVLLLDVSSSIGFSSFGVLLYYAVANAAALTQTGPHRRFPRALQVVGLAGCLLLAASLPAQSVVAGLVVLGGGVLYRILARAARTKA